MTTIHYMSDIHLEFGALDKPLPYGDVLVLAGDITLMKYFQFMSDVKSKKLDVLGYANIGLAEGYDRTMKFFDLCKKNFQKVFYITGNHESYGSDINDEAKLIKKFLPWIIHVKDNSFELDNQNILVGGTLWTDFNNNHEATKEYISYRMNDFMVIKNRKSELKNIWSPNDALKAHKKTLRAINKAVREANGKNVIVVTHHSPSRKGLNPDHSGVDMDYGYYSELEDWITERPQIKHWIFGHTHVQTSFLVGETNVTSNARGYYAKEESAFVFNPDVSITL